MSRFTSDTTKGKALITDTISLVNEHCMFNPRVQGANVGQHIKISSNDPMLHSTHPQNASTNATIYNVALPFKGFSVTKPLPAIPELIKVKCVAHSWMHAWIWELDNPYFATTGDDGHFTIKDVPPGTYTLVAWHEAAGETSTSVTVIAGSSELTGFTRDLSNRGVYFFLDLPENVTLDGDLEFLVELPPEITLSTCCLIRCQGRVVRTDGPTREMTGIAAEIVQYSIQREAA